MTCVIVCQTFQINWKNVRRQQSSRCRNCTNSFDEKYQKIVKNRLSNDKVY